MGKLSDQTVPWGKRAIAALPLPPPGKRATYHHPEIPQLVVIVTDRDARTFYFNARFDGRAERVRIGRFPACTPEAATVLAKEIEKAKAKGENPARQRRETRVSPTLAQYWEDTFVKLHVNQRLKPRTREQYAASFENHIAPALGRQKLRKITRADVKRLHADLGAAGKQRAANLAVAVLRCALNHAIDQERIPGPNPCDRIKLYPEHRRERFLSTDEIARLYSALDDDVQATGDWTVHNFVKLALLTRQRRANLLGARWQDFDLPAHQWRIPGAETKSKRLYAVHLAPGAAAILERRKQEAPRRAERVFPDYADMTAWSFIRPRWEAVRAAAGLGDVRLHDLRHSHASLMANAGAPLQVIGRQLGHASIATTQRYAHLVDATVSAAVDAAVASIGNGTGKAEPE